MKDRKNTHQFSSMILVDRTLEEVVSLRATLIFFFTPEPLCVSVVCVLCVCVCVCETTMTD